MKGRQLGLFLVVLAMIGGTAFGINYFQGHQHMGRPGIKAEPIAGSMRMKLYLPEAIPGYSAKPLDLDTNMLNNLPQDTSILQYYYFPVGYTASNEFRFDPILCNVVMMGTDRTSIHKPEFCLTGQGWPIDMNQSGLIKIPIREPHPYELDAMKFLTSRQINLDGRETTLRGIYVFWFVADNDLTADHWAHMKRSAIKLFKTGELERWAYISFFGVCLPGQEDATLERMKKFIANSVPQFMLATNPENGAKTASAQR